MIIKVSAYGQCPQAFNRGDQSANLRELRAKSTTSVSLTNNRVMIDLIALAKMKTEALI